MGSEVPEFGILMDKSMELQNNQTFRKQKEMESPFIKKVKKIMEDPQNFDVIRWNEDKTSIEIRDQKIFEQKVLSRHFRHSRISSFIRQLNLYGFKKIRSTENRIFTHSLLQKGYGLDSILNKKMKSKKNIQSYLINSSLHLEAGMDRHEPECNGNMKKEIVSEFRISQNLILNRENEKEDKSAICTKNMIPVPEQNYNTVWFVPVPQMQQPMWKFPCGVAQENMQMGSAYNFYPAWC